MWQNPTNCEELNSRKILWNFDLRMDSLLYEKNCVFETKSKKVASVGGVGRRVRVQGGLGGRSPPSIEELRSVVFLPLTKKAA